MMYWDRVGDLLLHLLEHLSLHLIAVFAAGILLMLLLECNKSIPLDTHTILLSVNCYNEFILGFL